MIRKNTTLEPIV